MSKVMLVEDDNNLREIYEARLQAEGYDIVTAHDGEEALVIAKAQQPDLIISDVMMPKISGFEMLDILRNTEGLKDVKVIMLTALGQADDQQRADRLGADSYLVKSQVTLEDIVQVAGRLLGGDTAEAAPAAPEAPISEALPAPIVAPVEPIISPSVLPAPEVIVVAAPAVVQPMNDPVADMATPEVVVSPTSEPVVATPLPTAADVTLPVTPSVIPEPIAEPVLAPSPPVLTAAPEVVATTADVAEHEPTTDVEFMESLGASAEATPVSSEAATVEAQIAAFASSTAAPTPEVNPVEAPPVVPAASELPAEPQQPAEQFITTQAPDLNSAVTAPTPTAQSAGNDDVLATALQSLTGQAPSPAPEQMVTTAVAPTNDNSGLKGGNRVIAPLDMPSKPDINSLLAIEEARELATVPGSTLDPAAAAAAYSQPVAAQQPLTQPVNPQIPPVTPAVTVTTQSSNQQPIDPNSIAL